MFDLNLAVVKRQPSKKTQRVRFRCGCTAITALNSDRMIHMDFCGRAASCPSRRWIDAELAPAIRQSRPERTADARQES